MSNTRPDAFKLLHLPGQLVSRGLHEAATAFAHTYWVAWVLVVLTLIPALMLPRRHEVTHLGDDDEGAAPVVVG